MKLTDNPYVYVSIHSSIYVFVYNYICTFLFVYVFVCIHASIYVFACNYICTCLFVINDYIIL